MCVSNHRAVGNYRSPNPISNVDLATFIDFRIQRHKMTQVEAGGTHTVLRPKCI